MDLLIGQRGNYLHLYIIIKSIDGMKLLDGPHGKTFAEVDQSGILSVPQFSSNFFTSAVVSQPVVAIGSKFIKDQPHPVDPHLVITEMGATVLTKISSITLKRKVLASTVIHASAIVNVALVLLEEN